MEPAAAVFASDMIGAPDSEDTAYALPETAVRPSGLAKVAIGSLKTFCDKPFENSAVT